MSKLSFSLLFLLCSLTIIVRCTRPPECELPSITGPCRAMFPSFYFNPTKNQCEEFTYGGCAGNANRFEDEEKCIAKCGGNKRRNGIIHEDE